MWYLDKVMSYYVVGHALSSDSPLAVNGKTDVIIFKDQIVAHQWVEAMNNCMSVLELVDIFTSDSFKDERQFILVQDTTISSEYNLGYSLTWDECDGSSRICILKRKSNDPDGKHPAIGQILSNPAWSDSHLINSQIETFDYYWAYKNRVLVHLSQMKSGWLHQEQQLIIEKYEKQLRSTITE